MSKINLYYGTELFWLIFLVLSIFTAVFPSVDLWVSSLFYETNSHHWVVRNEIMRFGRSGFPPMIIGVALFCGLIWLGGKFFNIVIWSLTGSKIFYLCSTLLIGPGIIVESILKVWSGRARPREIVEFGGQGIFTPALVFSEECQRNCSFVSGHAALGFWSTAIAFLFPRKYRILVFSLTIFIGLVMGLFRIMEGAHFISDVVFSGVIVIGINIYLANKILSDL